MLDWFSWLEGVQTTSTDCYSPDPSTGHIEPAWLEYIDQAVDWVTGAGLWITITMRNNVRRKFR